MKNDRAPIGAALPRKGARSKVAGLEKYAADYYSRDFLWAGVKRSDLAHARLERIDAQAARRIPGVAAVLTHADVSGSNRQGIVKKDQPVLVDEKVRRIGDPLALVLAESKEALTQALASIKVFLTPLTAVFTPEAALQKNAPLIHPESPGNVLAEVRVEKGSGLAGFSACDVVVEGCFELPRQEHAYLETEAGWAHAGPDGRLTIVVSTQSPHRDRTEVAAALGLKPEQVRVIAPYLGGGFGGKDGATVQALLGLAALNAGGRAVKMWWNREESFLAGVKRVPGKMTLRLGARADGTLHALECRILMDAGAYDHLCGEVLALAAEHAGGAYRIPHVSIFGQSVYTNNPLGGPFRGFGAPQALAAIEQAVDMLAQKLGRDPLEIRAQNALVRGDRTAVGVALINSTGALECLKRMEAHPLWKNRKAWQAAAGPFKRRGAGLALLWHGAGYGPLVPDVGNAKIELTSEGRFKVDASVADMGQGNAPTFLQIAGDLLNQDLEDLTPVLPDTDLTLPSGSSSASRTTYTYANALIAAVNRLKQRMLEKAAESLGVPTPEELSLFPGKVRHLPSGREIPLAEIAGKMVPAERVGAGFWQAPVANEPIRAELKSVLGLPHIVFAFAAHLARVEVDELTGSIRVLDYLAVTDGGRVINPQLFEQQIQGGIAQGLGYALYEDYQVENGVGKTAGLATYILPTAMDVPDMVSIALPLYEDTGPFGMKGIGEIPISGPLPAVANALADSCGVRLFRSPLTPERVLAAIGGKEKND